MAYYQDLELEFHIDFWEASISEGYLVYERYGLHMRIDLYCNGWELS